MNITDKHSQVKHLINKNRMPLLVGLCLFLVVLISISCKRYGFSSDERLGATQFCNTPLPQLTIDPMLCGKNCYDINLANDPCADDSQVVDQSTSKLRVFANYNLRENKQKMSNLVIVVHGLRMGAAANLRFFQSAIRSAKRGKTLVISFFMPNTERRPSASHFYWTRAAWRYGGNAQNTKNNSFRMTDMILNQIFTASEFAHVKRVLIAGHSAGGQFSHRYAAVHRNIKNLSHATFYYLIANPSSYVYLNNLRVSANNITFSLPKTTCSGYDDYPYGLANHADPQSLFDYDKKNISVETIRRQMKKRRVTYLLGELDNESANVSPLATADCSSMLQGTLRSRLNRGKTYYRYMQNQYLGNRHELIKIPAVAHSARAMYNAPKTIGYLQKVLLP